MRTADGSPHSRRNKEEEELEREKDLNIIASRLQIIDRSIYYH